MTLTLTITEAVPLGAASVMRLATEAGVRTLMIKGEVLEQQGLRGHYESVDVDVLVDPGEYDRYLALLAEHGWQPMTHSTAPSIIEKHAVTVLHEFWPISIDVHQHFPGFLTDPQVVFDHLWERRTTAHVAGVDVAAPDRIGHAAVVALHYLRDPQSGKSMNGMPDLVDRIRATFSADDLRELAEVAAATGSADTMRTFLDEVGAPRIGIGSTDEAALTTWKLRTESGGSTAWAVGIGRKPVWRWPAEVWHAIMLSDDEMASYHQSEGETLRQARWRRFQRGARQFPPAVAGVVRFRRAQRRKRA